MFLDKNEVQRPGNKYHLLAGEEARSLLEEAGLETNLIRIPALSWEVNVEPDRIGGCKIFHMPGTLYGGEWKIEQVIDSSHNQVKDCYSINSPPGGAVLLAGTPKWYLPQCPRGAPAGGDGGVGNVVALATTCGVEKASEFKDLRVSVDGRPRIVESWIVEAAPAEYKGYDFVVELPWPGDQPLSRVLLGIGVKAARVGARIVVLPGRDGGDPSLSGASWSYGSHVYSEMLSPTLDRIGVGVQLWVEPRRWVLWPPAWGGWSWSWMHGLPQGQVDMEVDGIPGPHKVDLARAMRESRSHLSALLYNRIGSLNREKQRIVWRRHGRPVAALRGGKWVWDGYVLAPELYGYGLVASGLADTVVDLVNGEVLYYKRPGDPGFALESRHRRLVYRVQWTLEELEA